MTAPTTLRVLLVDDHEDTLTAQAMLLRRRGYAVSLARDSQEALRAAAGDAIDVVVADLGLPDGDGVELMAELSRRYGLPGVALSGRAEADAEQLAAAGFVGYLTKPAPLERMIDAIETARDSRRRGQGDSGSAGAAR